MCSNSEITFICGFTMWVTNHFEMPRTRSQVPGGLPQLKWETNASNAQRAAAAAAREARAARRNALEADGANEATLGDCNPEAAVANEEDPNEADPNPCDRDPPHKVWMGIQACGVHDPDVAKSLAKNLFMSNFS